jgi:hypothetical protein
MSRYIRSQDLIEIEIDEDGDLILSQYTINEKYSILVNFQNIEGFINAITGAVKDGYIGDKNEMV